MAYKKCTFVAGAAIMLLVLTAQSSPNTASASKTAQPQQASAKIDDVEYKLERLSDEVAEVRRDELNYQLDRDLLKETYSSNLSAINVVITIVLTIFTILGFFGLRSIREMQGDYKSELATLTSLRSEYQGALVTSKRDSEDLAKKYAAIVEQSELQDKRLKVLEIQEKAQEQYQIGAMDICLEYIAVGLALDPDHEGLLILKIGCYSKLEEFAQSLEITESLIVKTKGATQLLHMINAAEFSLLAGNQGRFQELEATLRPKFDEPEYVPLYKYLLVLKAYTTGDVTALIERVEQFLEMDNTKRSKLENWAFLELNVYLGLQPDSFSKTVMLQIPSVTRMNSPKDSLKTALEVLKSSVAPKA